MINVFQVNANACFSLYLKFGWANFSCVDANRRTAKQKHMFSDSTGKLAQIRFI